LILDVLMSSDHGSTWTSLWASTPANRPTVVDGAVYGSGTAFDTTAFIAGNWLRLDVAQVGSTTAGQSITIELFGTLS
jgi:hypothetical protein